MGLEFDGNDDWIDMGSAGFNVVTGSLGLWVKKSASWDVATEQILFQIGDYGDVGNALYLSIHETVGLHFRRGSGNYLNYQASDNFNTDQWYYIVAIWNSTSGKLYVDGVEVDADTLNAGGIITNPRIGASKSGTLFFAGVIDDVRVYNQVLSLVRIQSIYHSRGADNIMAISAYGSDITSGQTYNASSETVGQEAAEAFDNIVTSSNGWLSDQIATNQWVSCQWGTGKIIVKIRIQPCQDTSHSNRNVRHCKLEGSNNGSDWTKIPAIWWDGVFAIQYNTDEIEIAQIANYNDWGEITFSNTTNYTYYRLYCYDNWTGSYLGVKEIEMMEVAGYENPLKMRLLMNEKPDGTAASGAGSCIDISGNDNHGTPVNSPVYRATPIKLIKSKMIM